jgi:hypothetical protein
MRLSRRARNCGLEFISDEETSIRVDALFEEAEKFCAEVGLHKDLMVRIYRSENDWTFILKIDALLETATKEIIKGGLKLKILNRFLGTEALTEFVDALPMNGKTSLLHLLKASGCPAEDSGSWRLLGESGTPTPTT